MIKKKIFKTGATIASKILEASNSKDNKQLQEWLNQKSSNKDLFEKLSNPSYRDAYNENLKQFNTTKAWDNIEYKLLQSNKKRTFTFGFYKYAAISLLVLSLGLTTHYLVNNSTLFIKDTPITLISSKASLTLANGDVIDLTKDTSYVKKLSNFIVDIANETVVYNANLEATAHQESTTIELNTITTDVGKDYKIVLSEGTIAHLNSGSSLKFPSLFSNNIREVEVTGEVLFDVQEDSKRPFIVKTKSMLIEVLGTTFNVNSYEDNNFTYTTLISGSLKVSDSKNSTIISPNQQAIYSKENSSITVKEVETDIYSSWTQGDFVFKDETLFNIIKSINRWYDFNFIFRDQECKEIRIGMNIGRAENFDQIYETLKNSGLFTIDKRGKTLIFSKKKI